MIRRSPPSARRPRDPGASGARARPGVSGARVTGVLLLASLAGLACGKKAPPEPPLGRRPLPVDDLTVRQQGDTLVLAATLPRRTTDDRPLGGDLGLSVQRVIAGAAPRDVGRFDAATLGAAPGGPVTLLVAIEDVFRDTVAERVTLQIALREAGGKPSRGGPTVQVPRQPSPPAPPDLGAESLEVGVRLTWTAPSDAPGGVGYHVYRREAGRPWSAPLGGAAQERTGYLDRQVLFGRVYEYHVRSVEKDASPPRESAPSPAVRVERVDRFPPRPPDEVRAVAGPEGIRVFWFPPAAADLAGFRIYRASAGREPALLLELPADATFHLDREVTPGETYSYSVTAVDGAVPANESAARAPVSERALDAADEDDGR